MSFPFSSESSGTSIPCHVIRTSQLDNLPVLYIPNTVDDHDVEYSVVKSVKPLYNNQWYMLNHPGYYQNLLPQSNQAQMDKQSNILPIIIGVIVVALIIYGIYYLIQINKKQQHAPIILKVTPKNNNNGNQYMGNDLQKSFDKSKPITVTSIVTGTDTRESYNNLYSNDTEAKHVNNLVNNLQQESNLVGTNNNNNNNNTTIANDNNTIQKQEQPYMNVLANKQTFTVEKPSLKNSNANNLTSPEQVRLKQTTLLPKQEKNYYSKANYYEYKKQLQNYIQGMHNPWKDPIHS